MPQVISTSRLDAILHHSRTVFAPVTLFFILYCIGYLWFYVPFEDFATTWRPDSRLVIFDVPEDSAASPYLQQGDEILSIGGQPVRRMRPTYPLPLTYEYEYIVRRDGLVQSYQIPFPRLLTPLAFKVRFPATILSLSGWLVGALILLFARLSNPQAIRVGSIFLVGAVTLIGIQAGLNGVPGAWIAGHSLIFVLAVCWMYLGFIPRIQPLPLSISRLFKILILLGITLAVMATVEVLYFFPQATSFQEVFGISLYSLGFLFSGIGLLSSVVILAVRAAHMPRASYLRQQILILLVFIGTAILPSVLLTIVPQALFGVALLPFPAAISLMVLIPAGYLFVIYRKGLLGLDLFFSRTIYLVLLSLSVFGFYAGGLFLVQWLLNLEGAIAIVPATIIFFPTLLITVSVSKPILRFVEQLVYGKVAMDQTSLAHYASVLSAKPEASTLDHILESLARMLDIGYAALILKEETGRLVPVALFGIQDSGSLELKEEIAELDIPLLRSATNTTENKLKIFQILSWAELVIPLTMRDEQVGILAFSRPGMDGFFNAKQVSFLSQAADVLAVGSENIFLFEAARKLSRKMMVIREEERKQVSLEIHDEPLQRIIFGLVVIDQLLSSAGASIYKIGIEGATSNLQVAAEHFREASSTLRKICTGLYAPFRDDGIGLAVTEIIHNFRVHHGLRITSNLNLPKLKSLRIPVDVTTTVIHILTEALNNVVKHAHHAQVSVSLDCAENKLILSIADNGPGSSIALLSYGDLLRRQHLGILGMHEWARLAQGHLRIYSNIPTGVCIEFEYPLSPGALKQQG